MLFLVDASLWDFIPFSLPSGVVVFLQAVYEEMCRVLATIHSVDIDAAELADFGKQGWFCLQATNLFCERG